MRHEPLLQESVDAVLVQPAKELRYPLGGKPQSAEAPVLQPLRAAGESLPPAYVVVGKGQYPLRVLLPEHPGQGFGHACTLHFLLQDEPLAHQCGRRGGVYLLDFLLQRLHLLAAAVVLVIDGLPVRAQLADALAVVGGIALLLVPVGAVLVQVHRPVLAFDLNHFIACFHTFLNIVTNITIIFEKNNTPKQKNMPRGRYF